MIYTISGLDLARIEKVGFCFSVTPINLLIRCWDKCLEVYSDNNTKNLDMAELSELEMLS